MHQSIVHAASSLAKLRIYEATGGKSQVIINTWLDGVRRKMGGSGVRLGEAKRAIFLEPFRRLGA